MSSKVHVTQCLCPKRHCIMAIAWQEPEYTPDTAKEKLKSIIKRLMERGAINGFCGICNSSKLTYEDGVTGFKTLDEAMPHLRAVERANLATKRYLDAERN